MASGVFDFINHQCNKMIDDYESEIISSDDLKKCIDLIEVHEGTFLNAVHDALKYRTFLALDF